MSFWTRLAVLAACALAVVAAVSWGSERAIWAALGCGTLGTLAGVEAYLRERFGGRHPGR
jgi:hypothetical protein